jgi:hypothetical protein
MIVALSRMFSESLGKRAAMTTRLRMSKDWRGPLTHYPNRSGSTGVLQSEMAESGGNSSVMSKIRPGDSVSDEDQIDGRGPRSKLD